MKRKYVLALLIFAVAITFCGTAAAEEQNGTQSPVQDNSITNMPNMLQTTQTSASNLLESTITQPAQTSNTVTTQQDTDTVSNTQEIVQTQSNIVQDTNTKTIETTEDSVKDSTDANTASNLDVKLENQVESNSNPDTTTQTAEQPETTGNDAKTPELSTTTETIQIQQDKVTETTVQNPVNELKASEPTQTTETVQEPPNTANVTTENPVNEIETDKNNLTITSPTIETSSQTNTDDASNQASNLVLMEIPTLAGMDYVYVATTGNDTTGDGSQTNPYQTISKGISTVNSGGTVYIASGTYIGTGNKEITINKNVIITGEDQTNTIIDAQGSGRMFTVNSGVTATVQNLTLENGNADNGGAILNNNGTLTVNNSTLTNNVASNYGGAIYIPSGTLNVNDSTLTGNKAGYAGGAIANSIGTVNINNSTLTGNTANVAGAIDNYRGNVNVDDSTFTGNSAGSIGGAISNSGFANVNNSTFTSNKAGYAGGAIWLDLPGGNLNIPGILNVNSSSFIHNAASYGGAIYDRIITANLQFSQIVGNLGNKEIYSSSGTVNAQNNWWGSNTSPATKIAGNVVYGPWIILTVNADPTSINTGETSQVTADLLHNSNGAYLDPANGHVPDGIKVDFTSTLGTIAIQGTIINGKVTETFQAGTIEGQANIQAKVDDQIVTTTIEIVNPNHPPVAEAGLDQTVYHNQLVTLDGSGSSDPDGNPITYQWSLTVPTGRLSTLTNPTSVNPTFTPDIPGEYAAQLIVTDAAGAASDPDTVKVTALNRDPVANAGGAYQANEGTAVTFNAGGSSDPDGDTITYQWDLDNVGIFESAGQMVSKTWGDDYTGPVTLKVTDAFGGVNTATTTVTINNVAPTVTMGAMVQPNRFFILPTVHTLTFNAGFTDPGWLDTHTAVWNWGDGTTSAGTLSEENNSPDSTGTLTVNHIYSKPGTYTVTLTVTDKDGASNTVSTQITVSTAQNANNITNNYIQNLPSTAFNGNARSIKTVYSVQFAADNLLLNLRSYRAAVNLLNVIKATTSGKNAWIKNTAAQNDVNLMLGDIIAYVRTLK